jgi:AcrR family transcriptional regulator
MIAHRHHTDRRETPGQRSGNGKARILEAAIDLVGEHGHAGATISEICKRAAVRPPTVYHHFGSKEGVIAAAVETISAAWLAELEKSLPAKKGFDQRLRKAMQGWQAAIEAPTKPVKMLLTIQLECADRSVTIRDALRRVHEQACAVVRRDLDQSGLFEDTAALADAVVGLVLAAALRFHLEPDRTALQMRLREIARMLTMRLRGPKRG